MRQVKKAPPAAFDKHNDQVNTERPISSQCYCSPRTCSLYPDAAGCLRLLAAFLVIVQVRRRSPDSLAVDPGADHSAIAVLIAAPAS